MCRRAFWTLLASLLFVVGAHAQHETDIPAHARVFIAPMDGFEKYISATLKEKKVLVVVVADRDRADFEISGTSESQKPGWAKTIFMKQTGTDEQASITVTNIHSSVVAFAYAVNKGNSVHGKQSAAEACAKHLKAHMDGKE